ncbi:MAG: GDP-fucose synthetase [Euryarchaeota archaeon]|nr:GDP-fucose synthetase [Euryarchaeota archaeon]
MEVKIKVLIFGSNGLVGSSIVKKFSLEDSFEVIPSARKDVNLFNYEETKTFIEKVNPNVVINAAAKVGGILANDSQRFDFIIENLKINMNILESLKSRSDITIINLGSSCIYPVDIKNPIKESSIMTGKLEQTNSPYAMAKLSAIEIGDAMKKEFGHKIINLMPTNLYGPNDYFNPLNSHVIPGMIFKFHEAKINNLSKVDLWGDGSPLREFLYVDDLADSILFIIKNNISDSLINIGSGEEISIFDLSNKIKNVLEFSGEINFDILKPNGIKRKFLDSSLIFSYGWKPKTSLEKGLEQTYDWFTKNYEKIRV